MGVAILFPITSLLGANSTSVLLGAMTLSVMLLPVIIRQTEESLIVVPDGIRMASLSLGATKSQTIFKVILPSALPGILSAILLGDFAGYRGISRTDLHHGYHDCGRSKDS